MTNMAGFVIAMIIMYVVVFAIAITNYVLTSLSLYTIAKRRLISNPWLAWLPIGNVWTMGSIADDYDAKMNIKRKWRVVLLTLTLVVVVMFVVTYVLLFAMIFSLAINSYVTAPEAQDVIGIIIPMYIGILLISICGVALSACSSICMFKIFESTVPHKALKYFLLSLLVPFASAICLFLSRNQGYSNTPANQNYPQNNQY